MSNHHFDKKTMIPPYNFGSDYINTARILCDRCHLCDRCMDIPKGVRTSDLCSECINETNNQPITQNFLTNMMQNQFRK